MSMVIENRKVTPEIAKFWMEKNIRNRTVNKDRVSKYAIEMKSGQWLDHHQGIAFYDDGTLADGQHRLLAVIESGMTINMVVAWGVPEESGLMIDGHQQRKAHQAIKISGLADWVEKDHVAVANVLMKIEGRENRKPTNNQIIEYCQKHKDAISFSVNKFTARRRFITTSIMRASVSCAYYYEDKDRLLEFCDVIMTGMPQKEGDRAAILIREWLIENSAHTASGGTRIDACKRIMRAIKAFCDHNPIGKLYQPDKFIYLPQ